MANLTVGAGGFGSIQAAVDAAANGDVITIDSGVYTEQLLVDGKDDLLIRAAAGADVTLKAPADLQQTALSSTGREIHAVVTVIDGQNVVLQNLKIDGAAAGNTVDEGAGAGQAQFVGVFFRNASGALEDVDVTGIRDTYEVGTTAGGHPILSGVQRGVGVQVDNDTDLAFAMHGGSISDFQKNATVFSHAILDVSEVAVTGGGAQTIIAQNGIQVLNSTGSIAGNTITGIGYAGPADAYSGVVLAYGNTDLDITGNTIVGANDETLAAKVVGVYVFDLGPDNSGGSIAENIISHVDEGIDVSGGIQPDGILVANNVVTNIDTSDIYAAGIYFAPDSDLTTAFSVEGTDAQDFLTGAAGDDSFDGGAGADNLAGGAGNDVLTGGAGDDRLDGGAGIDTAHYAAAATISVGAGWSVTDTAGTDTLTALEIVDDQAAGRILLVGAGGFASIQAAVDTAQTGDTILIASGTYSEQVTVEGKTDLSIRAADGATVTIEAPTVLAVNGVSDHFANDVRAVIAVLDSSNVTISGITVDGNFSGDTTPGSNGDELTGIAYLDSSGALDDAVIKNVSNSVGGGLFGLQHGSGLLIDGDGDSAVSVTGTTVTDFQKTGILIVDAAVHLADNVVTGIGGTGLIAQNGIQIGNASGTIERTEISEIGYSGGGGWYSSGLIAYEPTGPLTIADNNFHGEGQDGSFAGIDLSDTGAIAVAITGNTITDADYGLYAYTYAGGLTGLGTAPTLTGNSFSDIAIEAIRIDPEESYGDPFTTNKSFNLTGTGAADLLAGSNGADSFTGNGGNDTIKGRAGNDTVHFSGDWADYLISQTVDGYMVADRRAGAPDGADTVSGIETFHFVDGNLAAADLLNVAPEGFALNGPGVTENAANGSLVATASGLDDNARDRFTYSLTNDAGGRFAINATTGVLTVADGSLIDREAAASYAVGIKVTDAGGLTYERQITFVVADVDEFNVTTPVDSNGADNKVTENSANGTLVGLTVSATDGDATHNAVSYNLVDSAGGRFAIDQQTGVVRVANGSLLDFEANASHQIIVRAMSADGSTAQQSFTIALDNVPETQIYQGTAQADTFTAPTDDNWTIDGKGGNDRLTAAGGNDVIVAGLGNDIISAGGGDDIITFRGTSGASGFDTIDGGAGFDEIRALAANTVVSLTSVSNVELINANGFANVTIVGTTAASSFDFTNTTLTGIAAIKGAGGVDTIVGSAGADVIWGDAGNDVLSGGGGDDTFRLALNPGIDSFDGGNGFDQIIATANNVKIGISQISHVEAISSGGFSNITIVGTAAADMLDFSGAAMSGIVAINAGTGNDTVIGSAGNDVIKGTAGTDLLTGGGGNDVFDFDVLTDSRTGGAFDRISDFTQSADLIDLSTLDASSKVGGNQAFVFIGDAAFNHVAGELRFDTSLPGVTKIFADTDGNGVANFELQLTGTHNMTQADFVL